MLDVDFNNQYLNEHYVNNEENLMNSVLMPNRYSMPFILATAGVSSFRKLSHSMLEPKKLLFSWHKMYKPMSIIRLNHDLVIVR